MKNRNKSLFFRHLELSIMFTLVVLFAILVIRTGVLLQTVNPNVTAILTKEITK